MYFNLLYGKNIKHQSVILAILCQQQMKIIHKSIAEQYDLYNVLILL